MLLSLLLGAGVGLVMGLTGAGGGILAVPALVFGLHMTIAEAGPIGLLAVGIAAATGAIGRLWSGHVRYKAAALIAFTGALFAPFGGWLAHHLDTRLLSIVFALVLLRVGLKNAAGRRNVRCRPTCPASATPAAAVSSGAAAARSACRAWA